MLANANSLACKNNLRGSGKMCEHENVTLGADWQRAQRQPKLTHGSMQVLHSR